MNAQRPKAYRLSRYDPPPDLRTLLAQRGLRIVDVERRAGMARGSLQRVLAARRGRRMGLPTATKLAQAIGVSVGTFAAALARTLDEREESRRRWVDAELARLEAELG